MALFVLSLCPFDISVGVGAFVIGLSQISSFFSYEKFDNSELFLTERRILDDLHKKRNEVCANCNYKELFEISMS